MDITSILTPDVITFIIIPVLIFFARVCDVSIGTVRIIALSRGKRFIPPLLGFFEILIWLVAIGSIMENLTNFIAYIAYAAGFATGNFVGQRIEGRISMGMLLVRIITSKDPSTLTKELRTAGYGFTMVDATGSTGRVRVIYTVIRSSNLESVARMIKKNNPGSFYSVEDLRTVTEGIFPPVRPFFRAEYKGWLHMRKKSK